MGWPPNCHFFPTLDNTTCIGNRQHRSERMNSSDQFNFHSNPVNLLGEAICPTVDSLKESWEAVQSWASVDTFFPWETSGNTPTGSDEAVLTVIQGSERHDGSCIGQGFKQRSTTTQQLQLKRWSMVPRLSSVINGHGDVRTLCYSIILNSSLPHKSAA